MGASHTGHRVVFTTSDEIHLTADVNERVRKEILRNALEAEDVSTHCRRRLATRIPPAYPTVDVGDKFLTRSQLGLWLGA